VRLQLETRGEPHAG